MTTWRIVLLAITTIAFFALLLATPSCEGPSASERCNDVLGKQTTVKHYIEDVHGWRLDCAPPFPPPSGVAGWANYDSHAKGAVPHTVYLWSGFMPDDRVLIMIAGHEDGHILFGDAEAQASWHSWCMWPQEGVGMPGYGPPPGGDCTPFVG